MTPDREKLEHELLAYIEGTLAPDDQARIEIYLANTDPKLALQIAGVIDDRLALQSLPATSAPSDLADRIMAQIERQSLIGGVEKQLVHEPRRWFLNRMALAAGLFIVVGGFSFYVIKMVWHPNNAMHNLVLNDKAGPAQSELHAPDENAKPAVPLAVMGKAAELKRNEDLVSGGQRVALDKDLQTKELIEQGRMNALGDAQAAHAYRAVASTRDAFTQIESGKESPDAPVVITIVARNPQDMQRLETLLAASDQSENPTGDEPHAAAATSASSMARRADEQAGADGGTGFGGGGRGGFGVNAPSTKAAADGPMAQKVHAIAGTAPDTYHVLLRPDQLDQLSRTFAISSVARGNAAYAVHDGSLTPEQQAQALNAAPALPGGSAVAPPIVRQPQQPQFVQGNGPQPNINTFNGNNSNGGPLANNGKGDNYDNVAGNGQANGLQLNQSKQQYQQFQVQGQEAVGAAGAPSATQPAGNEKPADAIATQSPWIECVITIVPPIVVPGAATSPMFKP